MHGPRKAKSTEAEDSLILGLEHILALPFILLSSSILVLLIGQIFTLSFRWVAMVILCFTAGISLIVMRMALPALKGAVTQPNTRWPFLLLLTIGLMGAATSLAINRPDADDAIYTPKAVFYTEHPDHPIDRSITWIASDTALPESGQLPYYELTQAVFAWITASPFLNVYYLFSPGLVVLLSLISQFLLIRLFLPNNSSALFGVIVILLLMLVLGETHRTYGNMTIARAFQAKGFLIAAGIPTWTYFTLQFLRNPSTLQFSRLSIVGLALSGATTTAMALIPLLSVTLLTAQQIQKGTPDKADYKTTALYLASLIPLALMTLLFYPYAKSHLSMGQPINAGFPGSFAGQIQLLINDHYPITPLLMGASFISVILFLPQSRLFLAWISVLILLIINPISAPLVMAHLTSENIYWRLIFLLPFPLTVGISSAQLFQHAPKLAGIFLVVLGLAAIDGPTSVLRSDNHLGLHWAHYKINPVALTRCLAIKDTLPAGSMLAPLEISTPLITLTSAYPQFHTRVDFLQFIISKDHQDANYEQREQAYQYLYDQQTTVKHSDAFLSLINSPTRPRHVIIRTTHPTFTLQQAQLSRAGYYQTLATGEYLVFSLPSEP